MKPSSQGWLMTRKLAIRSLDKGKDIKIKFMLVQEFLCSLRQIYDRSRIFMLAQEFL